MKKSVYVWLKSLIHSGSSKRLSNIHTSPKELRSNSHIPRFPYTENKPLWLQVSSSLWVPSKSQRLGWNPFICGLYIVFQLSNNMVKSGFCLVVKAALWTYRIHITITLHPILLVKYCGFILEGKLYLIFYQLYLQIVKRIFV